MWLNKKSSAGAILLAIVVILSIRLTTKAQAPSAPYANFEAAQTNPVRLSADKTRLFAVNTANSSLSVFDVTQPTSPKLISEIPVGLGPVSVNPLNNDEVWVVNQISNSVSIVSVSKGFVQDTVQLKAEPMDVVFAGVNQAYVSVSRDNAIAVLDTITHSVLKMIPVFGGNPRSLAVSPDGTTVYAAFALSGNATTLINQKIAPPPPPPTNPLLPPAPQVGLIVAATDPAWTSVIKYKMPDNDVVAIKTGTSPFIAGYFSGVGTVNLGLAVNPVTGDLFVANTDALNLVNFQPNLRGHWVNSRITRIQLSSNQITPFDLNPSIDYNILPNSQALSTALSQPTNVVFDPGGSFMYVASFGTDRVAQVDTNGNVLSFVEVSGASGSGSLADPKNKRGPRGLAFNSTAQTLYSLNRLSSTISVINTSSNTVSSEIPVGTDPTPASVRTGRGFLYDAKLSGNGTGSCASCHIDGDMDHLAWNLGDPGGSITTVVQNGQTISFHPMKGPMTTQTLRGLLNLAPYHWRGEKTNFAAFNVAFSDLMGGSQLTTGNMALFTNFADSILFLPNPSQNLDRSLPTSLNGGNAAAGQNTFVNVAKTSQQTGPAVTCNSCHTANPGPGSNRVITTTRNQPMKVPELRNAYQKQLFNELSPQTIDGFGMLNDGSTSGFTAFFKGNEFAAYSTTQVQDMTAYLSAFDTGTAPAVGYTRTLTASTVTSSSAQSDWATLQSQAALGNSDLIARGTIAGNVSGLVYQPSGNNYLSNTGAVYTQSQLQAFILGGDTLSVMGVYPGTGKTQ